MFIIKSEDQRQKAVKGIEGFEIQIKNVQKKHGNEKAKLFEKAYQDHIAELREQIRLYDKIKREGIEPLKPKHLSEIGPYLVKGRIASELTQADLAKQLKVSQPMVYKYENSEYQGANLNLLANVAKTLNVSLHLETFQKQGSSVYSSKRQKSTMLHFIQSINNKFLGKTKLMKLLYYLDYEWIQKKDVSITGDIYIAMPYGPVPKRAEACLKQLAKEGVIRIEKIKSGNYDQERYLAIKDPDYALFSREEMDHLNEIAKRFEFWTAKQMSDLSHEDWPWQSTPLGEEIVLYQ